MARLTPMQLSGELMAMVNTFGESKEIQRLIQNILHEHPTLQQSFTSQFVFKFIEQMAQSETFDGRNESAVMMCKKLAARMAEDDFSRKLPLI